METNYAKLEDQISEVRCKVNAFRNESIHLNNINDVLTFYNYTRILKNEIGRLFRAYNNLPNFNDVSDPTYITQKSHMHKSIDELSVELTAHCSIFTEPIIVIHLEEIVKSNEQTKRMQTTQFAIFSIFITIIAFISTNIGIFKSVDENGNSIIDLKSVLTINLTYLIFSSVLFIYILLMLGFISKTDSRRMKLVKLFGAFGLPFMLIIVLIILAFCMK